EPALGRPIKDTFPSNIPVCNENYHNKNQHLDKTENLKLFHSHGPGIKENDFDVEGDENYGYKVELNRKSLRWFKLGDDPRLIWIQLFGRRCVGPKQVGCTD